MKNIIHVCIIALLPILLQSCVEPCGISETVNGKKTTIKSCGPPFAAIHYSNVIQGKITKGSLTITLGSQQSVSFMAASDGKRQGFLRAMENEEAFNRYLSTLLLIGIKSEKSSIYRIPEVLDIYIQATTKRYEDPLRSGEKQFPYIPRIPTGEISPSFKLASNFEGEVHVFMNLRGRYYYKTGNPSKRYLTYGKALADELKAQGITHPVGANDHVVIGSNTDPESIRTLMQAAKAVQDPRLLVIERTGSTGKVNITAFGETTTIDADKPYVWEFSEDQMKNLHKFGVEVEVQE